uniref:Uncharacterized protein n=1 Tax=Hyaloperonospora arabidopsidis (strain Emoy2) TaxID=559515 RepID=M4B490_HYAAE
MLRKDYSAHYPPLSHLIQLADETENERPFWFSRDFCSVDERSSIQYAFVRQLRGPSIQVAVGGAVWCRTFVDKTV